MPPARMAGLLRICASAGMLSPDPADAAAHRFSRHFLLDWAESA